MAQRRRSSRHPHRVVLSPGMDARYWGSADREGLVVRRSSLIALLMAIFLVTATTVAFAGKMHFTSSPQIGLGSLTVEGDLAGIGGGQGALVTVTGTATADVIAMCENRGGNQAPGQNPLVARTTSSDTFGPVEDNGKVHVVLEIPDPTLDDVIGPVSKKDAGCPNGNWSVIGLDSSSIDWVFLNITATSPTNPTYVLEGPCDTNLNAGTISCDLVEVEA